jgi:hypothetical protein
MQKECRLRTEEFDMIDPGTGYLLAQGGGTVLDMLGSLLGMGAKKKAQERFDLSVDDLQGMTGKPVMDIGAIQSANRAAMFPRIRDLTREVSARANLDQPRVSQYLTDKMFNMEAEQLPEQMQRNQLATSSRDVAIKQLIAQLRASQLG